MRIALAQINPVVGDLAGNRALILARLEEAKAAGADLVLFPELAVTGYPPEDLLLRPGFVRAAEESLEEIARSARGIVAVVGTPHFDRDLYNAAAVCAGGEVKAFVRSASCRTTASSTSSATSRRATASTSSSTATTLDRRDDLRGHVAAGAARHRSRARRSGADREHLRVAVPPAARPRARGDVPHASARRGVRTSPSATRSADRTS